MHAIQNNFYNNKFILFKLFQVLADCGKFYVANEKLVEQSIISNSKFNKVIYKIPSFTGINKKPVT